jgi:hypothetical protein
VLIALAALLAPLSVVAVWERGEIGDTDRFVETVAPLASDPSVQAAVTTQLTNLALRYVDVQGLTQQAVDALESGANLPPALGSRLDGLVGPITDGVRTFTHDRIAALVQSDAFAQIWTTANRTAHGAVVAALTGETTAGVTVADNAVTLDLAPFLAQVKQRLVDQGFTLADRIPAVNAQFTLFATMLIIAAALAIVRSRYLDALPPDRSRAANAVLFDTMVRFLRQTLRSTAVVALALALGAFFTGPSRTAVVVRGWITQLAGWIRLGLSRLGLRMTGVTAAVAPRAAILRAVLVVLAVVALIPPAYLTPTYVLWTILGLLVALFLLAVVVAPEPAGAPVPQPAGEVSPRRPSPSRP